MADQGVRIVHVSRVNLHEFFRVDVAFRLKPVLVNIALRGPCLLVTGSYFEVCEQGVDDFGLESIQSRVL